MSLPRLLLVAGCLAALLMNGCGNSSNDQANVRALNLISGASGVKITAGGTTIMTGGSFETLTGFTGIGAGNQEFKVTLAGSTGTLVDLIYSLSSGISFSFVTTGTPGATIAVLLADVYTTPSGSNFAFRVLDMSLVATVIDVYLTDPGADIATATPVVTAASFGSPTLFVNTPSGSRQMRITTTGTKTVIYDALVNFGAGTGQTLVTYGRGSGTLVNAAILASNTTGGIVDNTLAQFKVANGTAVGAPLNIKVDGTTAVSNLAPAAIAPYQTLAAGTRQITVESSASPGATLLTIAPNFVPATDTSIALSGPAGSLASLVLADSNPPVAAGRAQLRVVNISPDFTAVDVYANFGKLVSGLAANTGSANTLVDAASAGTTYQIDFNAAGTTTVVLSVPGLVLAGGHTYTVYLLGSGPTLAGVLTQDR